MNSQTPPFLSIVIPTISGRLKYLSSSLKTCVSQAVDNVEFIVSDNSTGDAQDLVAAFSDARIRYVRPDAHLPMSAHWNFALSHVRGDSICVIGDDDGLMPNALKRVNSIFSDFGNVPLHHAFCNYFWPDYVVENVRNTVVFAHLESEERQFISTRAFLERLYAGESRYVDGPMIYHNFIPRKVVDSMTVQGPFFRGATPDIYSAVAVAANVREFLSVGEYLTISGQGAKSTGANVLYGKGGAKALFSAYSNHDTFRSRFKSTALQMLILESIIEADKNFEMPLSIDSVDLSKFVQMAVGQTTTMPNRQDRHEEFIEIFKASVKLRVTHKVLGRLIRRAFEKQFGKVRKRAMQSWQGTLAMPTAVGNIFDASLELRTKLDAANCSRLAAA